MIALVVACVPAAPEEVELGGFSATPAPSEATTGQPFQSPDGWTIALERTAIRVIPRAERPEEDSRRSGRPQLLDPRYACEMRGTGLATGAIYVWIELERSSPDLDLDDGSCAVGPEVRERFRAYADNPRACATCAPNGPSLYVKGAASKDGRSLRFELALSTGTDLGPLRNAKKVEIVAGEGASVRYEVHFERMFAGGVDAIAAADADEDGEVTAAELDAAKGSCAASTCKTLLDQIAKLASKVVSTQTGP